MIDLNDAELMDSLKYLLVASEEKCQMETKYFDEHKQRWVPDAKEAFVAATVEKDDKNDAYVTVVTSNSEVVEVKRSETLPMNAPKFEKCNDMAQMTHLNDATIIHNLRERYQSYLIYTYSGLFCVVVNPYRILPIYTLNVINFYRGKSKLEVPPHLYLIADTAYCCMIRDRENQSMIITGESGAGKTENAKKAIQYFARIATRVIKNKPTNHINLEDQISSANPVLEAYGNAKTTRNNNSSRFGKFIRVHFGVGGNICGADIESYLLEKSRVTFQQPAERNFHIFYQLLSPAYPEFHEMFLVKPEPHNYFYMSQGMLTIDNVDDAVEMIRTNEAFDILNFTYEEKIQLFKCTCAIMHFGNIKWKQRAREEQVEIDGTEECEHAAYLLGVQSGDLLKGLMKPKIKVGADYVNKGQNKEQVANATSALCKSIYSRCFNWLVDRVNETLGIKTTKRQHFIGVLDIAGFEIFQSNGFEQLCINFTNEKLQQFFNLHMFVIEQEEYLKEEILWDMIDFRLDLQACINLIEKPMGIFSILEEECLVPKASEKTFKEKLYRNHFGKHPHFGKTKPVKGRPEAHFDIHHYAGTVSYNVTGWLEKNKDAKNPTVFGLFKNAENPLVSMLYQEHPEEEKVGKIKKKTNVQTISFCHRKQLNKLMTNLKSTHPHFVRCIIPNELKKQGVFDAHLVLHQLHCNNILEGIRISRKGFPVRMSFEEFRQRYGFLMKKKLSSQLCIDNEDNGQKMTEAIIKSIQLDEAQYRLGASKIFFRANTITEIEHLRATGLSKFISHLQAQMRKYLVKKNFKQKLHTKADIELMQVNFKRYLDLKNWSWWQLLIDIKHLKSQQLEESPIEVVAVPNMKSLATTKLIEDRKRLIKENEILSQQLAQETERNLLLVETSRKGLSDLAEASLCFDSLCNKCKLNHAEKAAGKKSSNRVLKGQVAQLTQSLVETQTECELEKNARERLSSQLTVLRLEFDELSDRLDASESAKAGQVEMCKRLDSEVFQLRRDLEAAVSEKSSCIAKMKKESQKVVLDMKQEVEELHKLNTKNELEKQNLKYQLDDVHLSNQNLTKTRSTLEKTIKTLTQEIAELNIKYENCLANVTNLTNENSKLQANHNELTNQLTTSEANINQQDRSKIRLLAELENLRTQNHEDTKTLISSTQQLRNITVDLEAAQTQTDEERLQKLNLQNQLNKVNTELRQLKVSFESEGRLRVDEADGVKRRMSQKLNMTEDRFDEMNARCHSLELNKQRLQMEVEDLLIEVEEANKNALTMERKQKQFEKLIAEWKCKCEDFSLQLEASQKEARQSASDLAKLKDQNSESSEVIETIKGENENLAGVIKDLMEQLDADSKRVHELEKVKRKFELEIEQMQVCLRDTNAMLEQDKSQAAIVNVELGNLRQKIDIILNDKEEEFENLKSSHKRALDAIESSLEIELKCKHEAIKQKKKLELELADSTEQINASYKVNGDLQARLKKLQLQLDELENQFEDECTKQCEARETAMAAERRASTLVDDIHEKVMELDKADKVKKSLEVELKEIGERLNECEIANAALSVQKRKLEADNAAIKLELDDSIDEVKTLEVKLKKSCEDAGRLAEELLLEQEYAHDVEKSKTHLEQQTKDLLSQLAEFENTSVKGGKRLAQKQEKRIADLETELECEQKNHHDTVKELRKQERAFKDLHQQYSEDRKKRDGLQSQLEKLHIKMRSYKSQIEETEELAAFNLSKFRRIQQKLEETNESFIGHSARGKSEQRAYSSDRAAHLLTYRF